MSTVRERLRVAGKAAVGIFSERSSREAHGLLSGIFPGQAGLPPPRGTKEILAAYNRMPWLRAVASRVSEACAATEWQLFVQRRKGERATQNRLVQRAKGVERRKMLRKLAERGELARIDTHPMLDLLSNANSFQTGDAMKKVTQLHIDLVGEAFWLKERNKLGVPVAVWPIPPDWVVSTPTPANPNYRVSFRGWRGLIPDTEFIWFANPDPTNPYGRGSGTARTLSDELETDEYAAKHLKAWFYNRARPDILVYPKGPTGMREEHVRRLEQDWLNRTQGFWRAFKPYFSTREVGVHEFDQNFRSMQLVQIRQYERDTILQVYGVPPEILGVLNNSNRATITAADLVMSRYVTEPRLEFQRSILQERLAPEYDERLIVDYISPVAADKEFQLDVLKAAPHIASVDEWRDLADLPIMEDDAGRVHFVNNGFRVLDPTEGEGLAEPPPEPALPNPAARPGELPEPQGNDDEGEKPKKLPWNLLGLTG